MQLDRAISQIYSNTRKAFERLTSRARDLIPGQQHGYSLTSPVLSGIVVTPQSALSFTAVYSAINVISTDVAKLPFHLNKIKGDAYTPALKDPRYALVSLRPNPEMNAFRYHQMQMGHVLGWGNHYSEIVRNPGDGTPIQLWPLHPSTTRPQRDDRGKPLYYEDIGTGRKWSPENILHIAGLGFDGVMGYSPLMMARQAVGLGMGAEQFGAALFGNGAKPGGMLKTSKKLGDIAAKRLRETWENVHGSTLNAHRTAVLEDGLEWVEAQISPESAQFLETRAFQVLEIARIFNIPPHKIGDYSQSHLSNVEESNLDYLTSTLQGWLEAKEAEYNLKLLFADEIARKSFSHDMSALLRGNMAARGTFYQILRGVGAINADTIAAREGLPIPGPENGGDKYLTQIQNIPVQDAGKPLPKAPTENRANHNHGADITTSVEGSVP